MRLSIVLVGLLAAMSEAAKLRQYFKPALCGQAKAKVTLAGIVDTLNLGAHVGFRATNGDKGMTAKGSQVQRVTQTYGGLEVYGTSAVVESDMNDKLTGRVHGQLAGGLADDIPDPEACQRDHEAMIALAISAENLDPADERISDKAIERIIYVDRDTETAVLAYRVQFFYDIDQTMAKPVYFIDACKKTVLFSYNLIRKITADSDQEYVVRHKREATVDECINSPSPQAQACTLRAEGVGGNVKTGKRCYNRPPYCLNGYKFGFFCIMANTYATVVDNKESWSIYNDRPIAFGCGIGYKDPVNSAFGVASDAMYFGDVTGRLYIEKYNGFRALPWTPKLVVHFGTKFDNAFWDDHDMYFGDGDKFFYPLVSQDILSHELAHGITTTNSKLEYRNQPGGIDESFSDISGEVAEVFGSGRNDWLVGADIVKGGVALRYFENPSRDGNSIRYLSDYYDGMNVHFSSGIFNHAFYKLVTKENIPIYRAYECFLHANRFIWSSTTGFEQGACNVMQAAYDIGVDHNAVRRAFSEVEIDLASCDYDAFSTTVGVGETRESILVSSSRRPIMKIDAHKATVEATAEDSSTITIEVLSDSSGDYVVSSGENVVDVDGAPGSSFYIRLSCSSEDDVKVTLTVSS